MGLRPNLWVGVTHPLVEFVLGAREPPCDSNGSERRLAHLFSLLAHLFSLLAHLFSSSSPSVAVFFSLFYGLTEGSNSVQMPGGGLDMVFIRTWRVY